MRRPTEYRSVWTKQGNCKVSPFAIMANFGCKSAIAFWIISVIVLILNYAGVTSWTFLQCWGLTTLFEKSLKMVPKKTEKAFEMWGKNVWNSVWGINKPPEVELPTIIRHNSQPASQ